MPHADNRSWMELLVGKMPAAPRRTEIADIVASRSMWDLSHLNQNLPNDVHQQVLEIAREDGTSLGGELYKPSAAEVRGVMLYMHGGGWCAGSVANERQIAMRFAALGMIVLNVEYRLAPEDPFPAAVEDCLDAARWLAANHDPGQKFGLTLAGQSAGANLAAVLAAALSSETSSDTIELRAAVLLSGIYSFPLLLEKPGSNIGPAELWHQAYLGGDFLRRNRDPLASPMFAEVSGFPPTYISCGDEDSFLPQALEFAQVLASHNVPLTLSVTAGLDHGFPFVEDTLAGADVEMARVRDWLATTTGQAP